MTDQENQERRQEKRAAQILAVTDRIVTLLSADKLRGELTISTARRLLDQAVANIDLAQRIVSPD